MPEVAYKSTHPDVLAHFEQRKTARQEWRLAIKAFADAGDGRHIDPAVWQQVRLSAYHAAREADQVRKAAQ